MLDISRSSTVSFTCLSLFKYIVTNASRVIRSAAAILTFASIDVKRNFRLFEAIVALDPNILVPVLVGHRSFGELLIEECLELARVAYGLSTEWACNVMLDVGIVAGTVERVPARKKNDA